MNIIKLQYELRGVPDNALIGYVQNPTGHVPSYLALSELQRRKDMRAKYESQQAPQSSVADDLEQEAAPQPQAQGVAGLPIPDQMFSGQGMAAGGIVAFEDGGGVAASDAAPMSAGMVDGGTAPADMSYDALIASGVHPMNAAALKGMLPPSKTYTGATASPAFASSSPYGTDMAGEMMRVSPDVFRYSDYGVGRGTSPYAGSAYSMIRKEMGSPGYAEGGEIKGYADGGGVRYDDGSVGYPIGGYVIPAALATGRFAAKYGGRGLKYLKDKALGTPKVTAPTMNLPTGSVTPVLEAGTRGLLKTPGSYIDAAVIGGALYGIDEYGNKEQITEEQASQIAMQKLEAENLKSMQDHTAAREAREKEGTESNQKQVKYGDKPADTKANTPQVAQQPAESEDDFLRRRMAIYKEYMGGDEDKTALKDKLSAMEKRAARQEEMAPWMALTEAGFKTMQGTSPYALANIGAGAEAGIKSYGGAQDKMAALEEKRYALMNDAAKADRAERQAAIQFGENSYQHKAAMDQRDRIANMNAALKEKELGLGYAKINSDANLLKMANFGIKDQAAIEKYVKNAMGTDALILENLRKLDPAKLDEKKKALLKTFTEKEARIQQEALQKYDVNNLINRARPGLANTTFKSSDYTVEELPGL